MCLCVLVSFFIIFINPAQVCTRDYSLQWIKLQIHIIPYMFLLTCIKKKHTDTIKAGAAPRRGVGGNCPPLIIIIFGNIFEVGINMYRSPPPPPPPPPYQAFSGLAQLLRLAAAVARHFALPKQTPWRSPCYESLVLCKSTHRPGI